MAKEVKKMRGTARIFDDDSMEFRPYETGKPIQKGVKKARKSSFYSTEGEKDSSYVMHLRVDRNATDPAAELSEDFDKLIKNVGGDAEERFKGKVLDNVEGRKITLSKKNHSLKVELTFKLEGNTLYKDELHKHVFETLLCFSRNQELIANAYA